MNRTYQIEAVINSPEPLTDDEVRALLTVGAEEFKNIEIGCLTFAAPPKEGE